MHRTDITVYTEAGAAFFDGRDPYAVTSPRGWHYLYPPLFAIVMSPLASCAPTTQAAVWFGVSVLLCCGCFVECRHLIRLATRDGVASEILESAIVVVAALTWIAAVFPILNTLQRGQVGVAVLYPLLFGFRLVLSQRPGRQFLGGNVLAIPVVLKLTPALPVGVVLLQRFAMSRRGRANTASSPLLPGTGFALGVLLFAWIVPSVFVGWNANSRHLHTWFERVVSNDSLGETNRFDDLSNRNQSLGNSLSLLTLKLSGGERTSRQEMSGMEQRRWAARLSPILAIGLTLLLIAVALFGVWAESVSGQLATLGAACGLSLMVSPISWGHHYTLITPATLFVSLWLLRASGRRVACGFAGAMAALLVAHYAGPRFVRNSGMLGLGSALWLAAALLIAAKHSINATNLGWRYDRGLKTSPERSFG